MLFKQDTISYHPINREGSYTIPDGITKIDQHAFQGSKLTSVTIPKGVTAIDQFTFSGCKNLKSVSIPDGLKTIGDGAFQVSSSLESITLPESVVYIEKFAFYSEKATTDITILNPKCEISDTEKTFSKNATIYGYTESTARDHAEKYKIKFVALDSDYVYVPNVQEVPYVVGDVNGDGEAKVSDLVALQKYLLGYGEIASKKNADLYEDNKIDIFDLVMLRKLLVIYEMM